MKKILLNIVLRFTLRILAVSLCINIYAQPKDDDYENFDIWANQEVYDFENWPGKDSPVKTVVYLPNELVSVYYLKLHKSSTDTMFFYNISQNENDKVKGGSVYIFNYSNVERAQLDLIAFLNCNANPVKPSRLTDAELIAGDVAFYEETDGMVELAFSRNNVTVILHSPVEITTALSYEIDKLIQDATERGEDTSD